MWHRNDTSAYDQIPSCRNLKSSKRVLVGNKNDADLLYFPVFPPTILRFLWECEESCGFVQPEGDMRLYQLQIRTLLV